MAKRSKRPRLSDLANAKSDRPTRQSRRRDPITTFARFSNFLSLGLIGAAFYMPFPDSLNFIPADKSAPSHPPITLDHFPDTMQKIAVAICHYRTPWITLGIVSLIITLFWYRTRYRPRRFPLVAYGPLIGFALVGLHASALGYLQHSGNGRLRVEFRDTAIHSPLPDFTAQVPAPPTTSTASAPATAVATVPVPRDLPLYNVGVTAISSTVFFEGSSTQWTRLFAADTIFMGPILFAWIMSFGVKFTNPGVTPPGDNR